MPATARRALTVALIILSCISSVAGAQSSDRPQIMPTRDTAVIYRVDGIGMEGAHKLQVTYTMGGDRTRVDYFRWVEAKYPFLTLIFDRPGNRLIAVLPERRAYIERPIGNNVNPGAFLKPDMRFIRKGKASVADTPCTEWKVRLADKVDDLGTACVTDDGVVMNLVSDKSNDASMTATVLAYVSPPTNVFDPPAEFTREQAR